MLCLLFVLDQSNFESLNHHGNFLSIRPLVFQIETLQLWLEI